MLIPFYVKKTGKNAIFNALMHEKEVDYHGRMLMA